MTARRRGRRRSPLAAAIVVALGAVMGPTACSVRPVAPATSPAPPEAVLSWQARNERGIYGYLVFRAEAAEGPFLRISREIVPAASGAGQVGSYRFVDRDVLPGKTYFYTLDAVRETGEKRRFSGVISKTVRR